MRKTSRALVVYEAHLTGGFGGEVAAIIAQEAFDVLDAPVTRVASLDVPVPFAGPLEDAVLPSADKIYAPPSTCSSTDAVRRDSGDSMSEPRVVQVVMPQMGESLSEGTIVKWLKQPGDRVGHDEPLFELSTDKVDTDVPAPAAGMLASILAQGRRNGRRRRAGGDHRDRRGSGRATARDASTAVGGGRRSAAAAAAAPEEPGGHFKSTHAPQLVSFRRDGGGRPAPQTLRAGRAARLSPLARSCRPRRSLPIGRFRRRARRRATCGRVARRS